MRAGLGRLRILAATGFLLGALVPTACGSSAPRPSPSPPVMRLPDGGTLYLGAGPRLEAMNLWAWRGDGRSAPDKITDLPRGRGISYITAGSGRVMVAEATDGFDKITEVIGHRLRRLINVHSFTPSLSEDGRLAYVLLRNQTTGGHTVDEALMVRDPTSGADQVLYESHDNLGPVGWGPNGSVAVGESDAPNSQAGHIVVIAPDGSHRVLPEESTGPLWNQASDTPIAVQYALIDPASGRRQPLPPGWQSMTWSPDGRWLLVVHGAQIGLIHPPDVARVIPLGTFPEPVWDAAWLRGSGSPTL